MNNLRERNAIFPTQESKLAVATILRMTVVVDGQLDGMICTLYRLFHILLLVSITCIIELSWGRPRFDYFTFYIDFYEINLNCIHVTFQYNLSLLTINDSIC